MKTLPKWAGPFTAALDSEPVLVTALLAYAAGDAFGVFYEFQPISAHSIEQKMKGKDGWPFGGVSDDTLLTLLTLESLIELSPEGSAANFLNSLRANVAKLRGLGPTTRSALGLPVRADERGEIGNTNGAIMRTALMGLFFTADEGHTRRTWVESLVKTTHSSPKALACAQITAAIFSNYEEPISLAIGRELTEIGDVPSDVNSMVLSREGWIPPQEGISLDPLETLLAVLWVVERAENCAGAYALACSLGGDTDTVAALAGALTSLRQKSSE